MNQLIIFFCWLTLVNPFLKFDLSLHLLPSVEKMTIGNIFGIMVNYILRVVGKKV